MVMKPSMFKTGHPKADLAIFRSVDSLTPFPYSPHAYEKPNTVVIDPFAYGGKGMAFGFHGPSQGPAAIGLVPGDGERGQITPTHYLVMVVPNPSWNSDKTPVNGRWLIAEFSGQLMEFAASRSQGQEVWYEKFQVCRQSVSQLKLAYLRVGDLIILSTNGNVQWTTNYPYGDRNTPPRQGDALVPKVQLSPTVPKWAKGPHAVVVENRRYFPEIVTSETGHMEHWDEGRPFPAWLPYTADDYDPAVVHPRCDPQHLYGVEAMAYQQMPDDARAKYRDLCGERAAPAIVVPPLLFIDEPATGPTPVDMDAVEDAAIDAE